MIKKLFSVLFSIVLLASFYVYAVLMEDENAREAPQWMVEETQPPIGPIDTLLSQDANRLASTMGTAVPLPRTLKEGKVESSRYHGYTVRLLTAKSDTLSVRGVRPLSAAPLIRKDNLVFSSSKEALFGYPVMIAQNGTSVYYYFATENAAFEISVAATTKEEAASLLSTLAIVNQT